jgi:hypothetical protein
MRDAIDIGAAPYMEDCVQVITGTDYFPAMQAQCLRFKELLEKAFPPVGNTSLFISNNPHDFGTYLEVAVSFNPEDTKEREYAFMLESKAPGTWEELERLAKEAAAPQVVGEDPRD